MKIIGRLSEGGYASGTFIDPDDDDVLIYGSEHLVLTDKYGYEIGSTDKNHSFYGFFILGVDIDVLSRIKGFADYKFADYNRKKAFDYPSSELCYCLNPKWVAGLLRITEPIWKGGPPQTVIPFHDEAEAVQYIKKHVQDYEKDASGFYCSREWFGGSISIIRF